MEIKEEKKNLAIQKRLKIFIQYFNCCNMPKFINFVTKHSLINNCCLTDEITFNEILGKFDCGSIEVAKNLNLNIIEVYANFVINLLSIYQLFDMRIKNIEQKQINMSLEK